MTTTTNTHTHASTLSNFEIESFRAYAAENAIEPDGSQCQWADYTLRALGELTRLRSAIDEIEKALPEPFDSNGRQFVDVTVVAIFNIIAGLRKTEQS